VTDGESFEDFVGSMNVLSVSALRDRGKKNIFAHRHGLDELVVLKDEADLVAANLGTLSVPQPRSRLAVDENLSARGREHRAEQREKRGLTASTGTAKYDQLASGHDEGHAIDDRSPLAPISHSLRQVARFDRECPRRGERKIHAVRRTSTATLGQAGGTLPPEPRVPEA
jgi:hypothetical protein